MVSLSHSTAFALLAALVSAQNPIVASIANQIVGGMASAKTDDAVSDADATSELQAVLEIVTKNPDMVGLFSKAMPIAMAGLNEQNFPELLSAAGQSLSAFEASPDYAKVSADLQVALPHYDVQQGMANVRGNLGGVFALVGPKLPELTPKNPEQWARATARVMSLANGLGLSGNAPSFAADMEDSNDSDHATITEGPIATATDDSEPSATGGVGSEDSTDDVSSGSPTDGSNGSIEDSPIDGSNGSTEGSNGSTGSTEDSTGSTEDSNGSTGSTGSTGESSIDDADVEGSGKSTVDDSDSTDDSSSSDNSTLPVGTGIDQANAANAVNAQVAAGLAVVAAFAVLV